MKPERWVRSRAWMGPWDVPRGWEKPSGERGAGGDTSVSSRAEGGMQRHKWVWEEEIQGERGLRKGRRRDEWGLKGRCGM